MAPERKEDQGSVWVLETQTKGTGANVVPLEKVLRKRGADAVPGFVFRKLEPREAEPAPHAARRFKLVDLMTREVLAEGVDARAAVRALEGFRSIVDVNIFVWEPTAQRWRLLTFPESRLLWDYRGRVEDLAGG